MEALLHAHYRTIRASSQLEWPLENIKSYPFIRWETNVQRGEGTYPRPHCKLGLGPGLPNSIGLSPPHGRKCLNSGRAAQCRGKTRHTPNELHIPICIDGGKVWKQIHQNGSSGYPGEGLNSGGGGGPGQRLLELYCANILQLCIPIM